MLIDPETFPLRHFAGPLGYRVQLKVMSAAQKEIWKKWLHAYSSAIGLSCAARGDLLHIEAGRKGQGVPPSVRRAVLAWLVGHEAVAAVTVVTRSRHPGLTIELVATSACP